MRLIILTGINKGLGEAIFNVIKKSKETNILVITRRLNLKQTDISKSNNVDVLIKDLSEITDVSFITSKIDYSKYNEIVFINNAASILPIGKVGSFKENELMQIFKLNTLFPMMLINDLVKEAKHIVKIVNVSSGAAKTPIEGWALYCSTKASNEMYLEVLIRESIEKSNIFVYNIDPGVMNTDMQKVIRSKSQKDFPRVSDFKNLKESNQLVEAEDVANDILMQCDLI